MWETVDEAREAIKDAEAALERAQATLAQAGKNFNNDEATPMTFGRISSTAFLIQASKDFQDASAALKKAKDEELRLMCEDIDDYIEREGK